jgi:hypothetical protein
VARKVVKSKVVGRPANVDEDGVIHDEAYDMTSHRTVGTTERPKVTKDRQSATGRLRAVPLGYGLPDIRTLSDELETMTDVLMGRVPPTMDAGTMTLMEIADAYFARASEITMLLQKGEREGTILRGSAGYKFRTGELRTFLEMARKAAELGSRRLTHEALAWEMERTGKESRGGR